MVAIVSRDPTPISELRSDVPTALELVVQRCLEKERDERFESARDVAFALEALSDDRALSGAVHTWKTPRLMRNLRAAAFGAAVVIVAGVGWELLNDLVPSSPALPAEKHLAVLDFTAVGDDRDLRESAIGLGRVVAAGLSIVEQESRGSFWVIPRGDAEKYNARTAEESNVIFGATIALVGQLRRSGNRLRLDLEIMDAESGRTLGRVSIEDSASNLSSFQEEPVLRVSEALRIPVSQESRELLASTATSMPEGFMAYIQGLGVYDGGGGENDVDRAIRLLETATSLDPLFAAGKIALGRAYLRKFETTGQPIWIDRAASEASLASNLEPQTEGAYCLLADVHRVQDQIPAAISALENATQVAPASAGTRLKLAEGYKDLDRFEESVNEARLAIFLRPGYWPAHDFLAKLYIGQGDYVAAAIEFEEVISCAPLLTKGYNNLGGVLVYLERTEEARKLFEKSIAIEPSRSTLSNLGAIYFDERRFADAATMFERAIQEDDSLYKTWGNLGYAYRFGPAPEKADDCFRSAVELSNEALEAHPDDLWTMTELAGYYAMLDQPQLGRELLDQVVNGHTVEPQLMAQIAETFEDLGDRENALEWVARSFAMGISPSRFEIRPTLRELVADKRYQQLVLEAFDHS